MNNAKYNEKEQTKKDIIKQYKFFFFFFKQI